MHYKRNDQKKFRLCVTTVDEVFKIISEHHYKAGGGHIGIGKMITRINARFFWPGIIGDIYTFVSTMIFACKKTVLDLINFTHDF